jgi:hypothetical protein
MIIIGHFTGKGLKYGVNNPSGRLTVSKTYMEPNAAKGIDVARLTWPCWHSRLLPFKQLRSHPSSVSVK